MAHDAARRTQVVGHVSRQLPAPRRFVSPDHADVAAHASSLDTDGSHLIYSADGRRWSAPVAGGAPTDDSLSRSSLSFDRPPERRLASLALSLSPERRSRFAQFMGLSVCPPDGRTDRRCSRWASSGFMPVGARRAPSSMCPYEPRKSMAWSPTAPRSPGRPGFVAGKKIWFAADLATGADSAGCHVVCRVAKAHPAYAPRWPASGIRHESQGKDTAESCASVQTGASLISDTVRVRHSPPRAAYQDRCGRRTLHCPALRHGRFQPQRAHQGP
jgi:hypothetical protein